MSGLALAVWAHVILLRYSVSLHRRIAVRTCCAMSVAHKPFVKQVPQGAHVVVALGAVHAVIDGDKADALLGEGDLCK